MRTKNAKPAGKPVLGGLPIGPRVDPNIIGGEPFTILAWEEWMQSAMCLDSDPENFYPGAGQQEKAQAAKRICESCPVVGECLAHALKKRERYGIWGGKSPKERREAS